MGLLAASGAEKETSMSAEGVTAVAPRPGEVERTDSGTARVELLVLADAGVAWLCREHDDGARGDRQRDNDNPNHQPPHACSRLGRRAGPLS